MKDNKNGLTIPKARIVRRRSLVNQTPCNQQKNKGKLFFDVQQQSTTMKLMVWFIF